MFRRLFFLRAESAAVRLRHSGHMLPATEVGIPQRNRMRCVRSAFWRRASSYSRGRVEHKAVKRGWVSDDCLSSRRMSAARVDESKGTLG